MFTFNVRVVVNYRSKGCNRTNEDVLEGPIQFTSSNPDILRGHLIKEIQTHYKDLLIEFKVEVNKINE